VSSKSCCGLADSVMITHRTIAAWVPQHVFRFLEPRGLSRLAATLRYRDDRTTFHVRNAAVLTRWGFIVSRCLALARASLEWEDGVCT